MNAGSFQGAPASVADAKAARRVEGLSFGFRHGAPRVAMPPKPFAFADMPERTKVGPGRGNPACFVSAIYKRGVGKEAPLEAGCLLLTYTSRVGEEAVFTVQEANAKLAEMAVKWRREPPEQTDMFRDYYRDDWDQKIGKDTCHTSHLTLETGGDIANMWNVLGFRLMEPSERERVGKWMPQQSFFVYGVHTVRSEWVENAQGGMTYYLVFHWRLPTKEELKELSGGALDLDNEDDVLAWLETNDCLIPAISSFSCIGPPSSYEFRRDRPLSFQQVFNIAKDVVPWHKDPVTRHAIGRKTTSFIQPVAVEGNGARSNGKYDPEKNATLTGIIPRGQDGKQFDVVVPTNNHVYSRTVDRTPNVYREVVLKIANGFTI